MQGTFPCPGSFKPAAFRLGNPSVLLFIVSLPLLLLLAAPSPAPAQTAPDPTDGTAPAITGISPAGWGGYSHPTITAAFSDAGSGIDPGSVSVLLDDADITAACAISATGVSCPVTVTHGMHTVRIAVNDNAGNTGSAAGSFGYDATMPQFLSRSPLLWSTVTDPAIEIEVADYESGIIASSLKIYTAGNLPLTGCATTVISPQEARINCPTSGLSEGLQTFYLNVSTVSRSSSIGFGFRVDTAAPAVTNLRPSGWTGSNSVTIQADLADAGSGVATSTAVITVDGAIPLSQCAVSYNGLTCNVFNLTEGSHVYEIRVSDSAGNTGAGAGIFSVDLTAPSVTNISPAGIVDAASPIIEADIFDSGSGIDQAAAAVSLDNGPPLSGCAVTATHLSCPAGGIAPGHHSVKVTVGDRVGRTAQADGWFDLVVNHAPLMDPIGDRAVDEASTLVFGVAASDPDGDPLTFTAANLPAGAGFDPATGVFSWTPDHDQSGSYADVLFTVTDGGSPQMADSKSITITVNNVNRPPVLTFAGNQQVAEGQTAFNQGTVADPDGDPVTLSASAGAVADDGAGVWHWSLATLDGAVQSQNVAITATDGRAGSQAVFSLTVNNVAPSVGAVSGPYDPMQTGAQITAGAAFSDPGTLDTHVATWEWGDGSTSAGTVTESGGSGLAGGGHAYVAAGVYTVRLTLTDKDGGSATSIFEYVVVFDPSAGFVTGGGWIDSPAGAYSADPALTGKANFGFVSRYLKGASTPSGQTAFQFKTGSLNFHSTSYEWLVASDARAQYKGSGIINGAGDYGFLLTAVDGQANGGGGSDRFRIKIWDKAGGAIIYDNMRSAADSAEPVTVLTDGSIVIHE